MNDKNYKRIKQAKRNQRAKELRDVQHTAEMTARSYLSDVNNSIRALRYYIEDRVEKEVDVFCSSVQSPQYGLMNSRIELDGRERIEEEMKKHAINDLLIKVSENPEYMEHQIIEDETYGKIHRYSLTLVKRK